MSNGKQKRSSSSHMLLAIGVLLVLALSVVSIGAQDSRSPDGLTAVPGELREVSSEQSGVEKAAPAPAPMMAPQSQSQHLPADELREVSIIVTFDDSVNPAALEAVSGGEVIHRYKEVFNGVSMVMAGDQVASVAAVGGVTGIYLDELLQIDTDASPEWIDAPVLWTDLGGQESAGEGVIIGVLDTGVWPEHPSYSDPDPFGKAYDPPPTVPGSNGIALGHTPCDFGDTDYNPNDAAFSCNNKLIGAYDFTDSYKAFTGLLIDEFDSARDANGHGTHTSSTAAGNGGVTASIFGVPRGTVSGIAPRAHVIMYKVCGDLGCYSSDSAAAVEQAILDEVDAINFSISGGSDPYGDIVSLAFLSAYENGVFVAASAGNSGPGADTVAHREPWTTTVGASTSDRHFLSTVTLEADNFDTLELEGASLTAGISSPTLVVFPPATEELCLDPFAPGTFNGEIVICMRGVIARVEKSFNVAAGGAGGMLLYNPTLQGLATDNHFIPSVHLENDAGEALLGFMSTHTGVTATFTDGTATAVQGDKMAAFSSRGGPGQTLGISKPDITAPGVQILAGHTPMPATVEGGLPGELFQSIQGTSMSSPHIAGSAALVKAAHPDWTPGQVKSALMMTSKTDGVTKEDGVTPADAFDFGSGRVDLSKAGNPGITISATGQDFIDLEDELWNANLPSLYYPVMPGKITVKRTIQNETGKIQNWKLTPSSPDDVDIMVPRRVRVSRNDEATFYIVVDARQVPLGETRFATIEFKNGNERLTFPITIVRGQPDVTLNKTCDPAVFPNRSTTDCVISIENTGFDAAKVHLVDILPRELRLDRSSIVGAHVLDSNGLFFNGTLAGAAPPIVNVTVDPLASPAGYLGLAGFGGTIDVGATDESIANYNVPSFEYAGESYSQIGIVSNGYVVVGGGTGADVDFVNSDLPDPAIPNNILAPFWTDLNPSSGGRVLINVLAGGGNTWTVVEWELVENWGDGLTNTFQIWIGSDTDANPGEDISFVYGADVSLGDGGWLTVGAENKFGNSGGTVYLDGNGIPPSPSYPIGSYEVDVFSIPGEPGETHEITYTASGYKQGEWTNCAWMSSDLYQGENIVCFDGEVTKK